MFPIRSVATCVLLGLTACLLLPPSAAAAVAEPRTTEQQWIVQSILEDLARMTLFAGREAMPAETAPMVKVQERPADAQGAHFTATVQWPGEKAVEQAIDLPVQIWNAEGYAKVAAGFLAKRKLGPEARPPVPSGSALHALTAFDTATLEKENRRISQWVTEHPLEAEAHAQAALLLAVFACRETAGAFYDTRGALNRGTAHLALAQALGQEAVPSDAAAVAALLFTLHTGRQIDTEAALQALEPRVAQQPELGPWVRAAKLRERGNWRLLEDYAKATPLERVEYYRALQLAIGTDALAKEQSARKLEPSADWSRIALTHSFSVGSGHVYTPMAIPLELREIAAFYPELAKQDAVQDPAKLAGALNQTPRGAVAQPGAGAKPAIEIIDRGAWALHFQRHLCHAIRMVHFFLETHYGAPAEAAQLRDSCDQAFGKLWLYPLVTLEAQRPDWVRRQAPAVATLISQHPEWVEPRFWLAFQRSSREVATLDKFYSRPMPEGTLYGYVPPDMHGTRWKSFKELQITMADTAKLDRLVELAPWNRAIVWGTVTTKNNEKPTPEQTLKAMEPFLNYDLKAMTDTATMLEDNPKAYARVMRKAAEFNPKTYITLMNYLSEHQLEAEAAAAYEAALANAADPVMLANHSDWVVNYYFDHGMKDRAEKAAAFAAEVYSNRGLATMARLRERQGRRDEAEQWLVKISERYHDVGELIGFYRRNGGEKPDSPYAKKLKDLASPVFPKGFQKVELKDFTGPPQQGVLVASENDATSRAGLKLNDVIVALNGDRTDTFEQYAMVRDLDGKPDMRILLYRAETGYLQITCRQPYRKFNADFVTYQGKGAKRAK